MKHLNQKRILSLFLASLFFLLEIGFPTKVSGAVQTSALKTTPWHAVAEHSIIDEKGWLQSMCATDQYIVCLINGAKKTTDPDTLIAFYRNSTDAEGNPVKPYSYAFHVTETDFEHGNGMTYNPNTQEIAIAGLFTNDPSNGGAIFIVDANTLKFKRKVTVGNGRLNYFGIDYIPEKDQYVLMANRISDYSFIFTDADFQIVDTLNLRLSYSRSSFQDFIVTGDSIISIPYMQREGYMNIVDVYSISQKQRIGSYYLTLPGHDSFDVEPEGICQLEPGHLLMASSIHGSTKFKLYEVQLPLVHRISTRAENGSITESSFEIPEGESHTVAYSCEETYRLKSLIVDGQEQNIADYPSEYTFTDIHTDHTVSVFFEEIPRYTVHTSAQNGTIDENPSALEHHSLDISFVPEKHYELDALIIDQNPVPLTGKETSYSFPDLTSDHSMEVIFKPIPTYTIYIQTKNGEIREMQETVYRDTSYTTKIKPKRFYSLSKCFIDGKPVSLKDHAETITLKNIQSDHMVTLVYESHLLRLIYLSFLLLLVFCLVLALLHLRRLRRHQKRNQELRRIRRENREFFRELDELEEVQKQKSSSPDD